MDKVIWKVEIWGRVKGWERVGEGIFLVSVEVDHLMWSQEIPGGFLVKSASGWLGQMCI